MVPITQKVSNVTQSAAAPESPLAAVAQIFPPEFVEDPYPFYAQLRATAPIMFIEPMNAWLFTRYDDVQHAASDDGFQVNFEEYQVNRMGPEVVKEKYYLSAKDSMVCNDAPDHTRMRKVFARGFTAKRVKELPAFIESYAHGCLDRIEGGQMDVVPDYARRVPLGVLSHLLGVPSEDWPKMATWVQDYAAVLEVFPMTVEQMHLANDAAAGLEEYFTDMIGKRRRDPQEDFVTEALRQNEVMEDNLSDAELVSNLALLYFGGHDTQEKMFGNILNTLDNHRDQFNWLAEDVSRVDVAMPELLRYDTVGQFMGRSPRESMEYKGFTIEPGQTVMVCFGAANRDPEVFPDPDKLDFGRSGSPAPNITFGAGRHRCIGAALAQKNLPIMLKVLLERCPDLQIDRDGVQRHFSLAVRGFDALPVTWRV